MNTNVKAARSGMDAGWNMMVMVAVAVGASMLPDMVMAATSGTIAGDSNAIEQVMCNVVLILTGTTGKAVATVAVIAVGVGALLGKISWGMALIVALGIALIFGAASIVTELGGNASGCTSGTIINS
jgi:type IV secretory pathway VirB2 component (pilin)